LIVVVSPPITFLLTFIVMSAMGLLEPHDARGIAFSVGMVVDASIVVAENVRRHLAENRDPTQRGFILVEAMSEVARPVSFSVLIIALVLVPLFTLQGLEGKMFAPLAMTLLVCLLVSIGVAMVIVPALSSVLLKQAEEHEFRAVWRFREGYLRLLQRAMRHPKITVGAALVTLALSLLLVPFMGTEFMPPLDEGSIAINVVRLPIAPDGMGRTMLEKRLLKFPEVSTVVSKTWRAEISEDPMGPEQTDVFVMLKPRKQWKTGRNKAELVEALSKDLSQVPGIRMSFSQPIALGERADFGREERRHQSGCGS
jgi:cobalt-zinc-cadmium resistance protein CzcA